MLQHHKNLIKPSFLAITPYVAGKNAELLKKELKLERVIKLASNENALGASKKALRAAREALSQAHRYPDSNGTFLKNTLAEKFSVDTANILLCSGSDSLFHTLAQAFIFPGDEVIISEFAFASYEIATLANQGKPIIIKANHFQHDLPAMLKYLSARTKLIFLANPNNPTGTWFTHQELLVFMQNIPSEVLVILDEAYYEFMSDYPDYPRAFEVQKKYPNLIISRTFSKIYGLAGFRISYAFADSSIIELIEKIRSPFTITSPSLAAAEAAVQDEEFVAKSIKHNTAAKKYFLAELKKLNLQSIAQAGNFVTVDFGDKTDKIFQELLQKGIILRPLKNYKMPDFLRITLGLEDELQTVVTELKKYYN